MNSYKATDNKRNLAPIAFVSIVVLLIVCMICLCLAFAAYYLTNSAVLVPFTSRFPSADSTQTPQVIRPPQDFETETNDSTPNSGAPILTPLTKEQQVARPILLHTLSVLEETHVPLSDPVELALRLGRIDPFPQTLEPPETPFQIGRKETFWVGNMDTNISYQIAAELSYITDHVYFWIQEGIAYQEGDLQYLAETFETHIYPTTRDFFGSEWNPGIDNDPHIYILYATDLGSDLAGSFSSTDEYPPAVYEYSNAHEIFLLNADNVGLGEQYTYGVLAHELQHMILWNRDRNEQNWLNEGFAELATFINGYYDGSFDRHYTRNPDIQLNDWPNHQGGTFSHYGASFLFINYFLGRFGTEVTQALVAHPEDGFTGIDAVLQETQVYDDIRNVYMSADEMFLDWLIATYLNDTEISDGRYAYPLYPQVPKPSETENITTCPTETLTRDVSQYGADYIGITCDGEYTLRFEGSIEVDLLPVDPYSGSRAFWSNKGDEADMTLSRQFDFSTQSAPLTLSYRTWYDIEADYDYLYLLASSDGENWQILRTPSGTPDDPSGNSFGWAYNGTSGGQPPASWIHETVDISQFAGQIVYLRFEYITDSAVHGEGFLLDDISIPQIGYFSDFENDSGGWEPNGWARIQNSLPQTFQLALLSLGDSPTVDYLTLGSDVAYDIPLAIGDEVDEVVLVISGTTRHTRQRAAYQLSIVR